MSFVLSQTKSEKMIDQVSMKSQTKLASFHPGS